jgi:CRP/FNR family cyclic AMP-dependent transcriptional regulator
VITLGPFADVPEDDLDAIRALATHRSFARGEVLIRRGDPADHVAVIQSGVVAVQVRGADDRDLTLALLGEGEAFGEMALAGVPRRTASVSAVTPADVLALDVGRLRVLAARSHGVDAAVMGVLADTVRRLTEQLLEATLTPQPVRLRRILLRLHRVFSQGRIALTHEQLSELLGSRRSTVTQLLADEAAAGHIETGRGYVRILDEPALRLAARG